MALNKQNLRTQLISQANSFTEESGRELDFSILDTAAAILSYVNTDKNYLYGLSEDDYEELYARFYPLIDIVDTFLSNSVSLEENGITYSLAEVCRRLRTSNENLLGDRETLKKTREQISQNTAEHTKLTNQLNSNKKQIEKLFNDCEELKNELKEYSEERIETLKNSKKHYKADLEESKQKFQTAQAEVDKVKADIKDVDRKISAVPDEIKRLREEYDGEVSKLEDLEETEKVCTPKAMRELDDKIAECSKNINELNIEKEKLENEFDRLSDDRENLTAISNAWKERNISYSEENETFENDILERVDDTLAELYRMASERKEYLDYVKKQADELKEKLTECKTIHKEYSGWLEADKRNVDAMISQAESNLSNDNIRNTLAQQNRRDILESLADTGKLLGRVSSQLNDIDDFLASCIKASNSDYEQIKRNVNRT